MVDSVIYRLNTSDETRVSVKSSLAESRPSEGNSNAQMEDNNNGLNSEGDYQTCDSEVLREESAASPSEDEHDIEGYALRFKAGIPRVFKWSLHGQ